MGNLGARAVDKRMRFVTAAEAGEETMTALCRRFGLSRKTGYKWLARYRLHGIGCTGSTGSANGRGRRERIRRQ